MSTSRTACSFCRSALSSSVPSRAGLPTLSRVVVGLVLLAAHPLLAQDTPPSLSPTGYPEYPADASGGVFSLGIPATEEQARLSPDARRHAEALSFFYQGLMQERTGMVDRALDAYENALRSYPGNLELARRASELAGQFGDTARGLALLETTQQLNLDDPAAYILLSEYLSTYHENRRDFVERSLSIMEDATQRFPESPAVYERLMTLYLMGKDTARAKRTLDRALAQPSEDPYFWLEMGRIAPRIYSVREDEAPSRLNEIYEKAYQFGKDDVAVAVRVADYYRLTRQLELARDRYEEIVRLHPEELEVRQKLAGVYSLLKQEDKVLETLVELERINPHHLETQRFIAGMYLRQNNFSKSIEHYLKAFRIAKGTSDEYQRVAWMLRWESRPDEAIDLLQRAQFHYPEDLRLMIELGVTYNAADQFQKAFDTFQKSERISEKLRPDLLDDNFYFSYGAAAERLKRFDLAADYFRKSIDLAPVETEPRRAAAPYNYLGYMWLEQDMNIEEAGQLIIRANDLVPDSGAYIDSLGWYYFKKQNYPEALKTLLRAEAVLKESEEEDGVVCDHIGQAYFQLGHLDMAISYLVRASELEPENQEFKDRLEQYRNAPVPTADQIVPLDFLGGTVPAAPSPKPIPDAA